MIARRSVSSTKNGVPTQNEQPPSMYPKQHNDKKRIGITTDKTISASTAAFIILIFIVCSTVAIFSTSPLGEGTSTSDALIGNNNKQQNDECATNNTIHNERRVRSQVKSMFNCDLPNALCKYWYPHDFFYDKCGLGRDHAYQLRDAMAMYENNTLWPNMPKVGFPTLTLSNVCFNDSEAMLEPLDSESTTLDESILYDIGEHIDNNDRCITERLSMIHVHKSGGTSLHSAFNRLARKFDRTYLVRHAWFTPHRRMISPLSDAQLKRLSLLTVGKRIQVNWPNEGEGKKYNGTIIDNNRGETAYDEMNYPFTIAWDDYHETEVMDLALEEFEVIGTMEQDEVLPLVTANEARKKSALMMKKRRDEEERLFVVESLKKATTYPSDHFEAQDHVLFAVVRDPTERFISSIGQAMGGKGSKRNIIGPILQEACIKSTSAETLKCMAKYVRDHGHWIELHFAPQVIDIAFTVMSKDVPIALFSFKNLQNVIDYLGSGDAESKHRDRPHPVLRSMSVQDYDEESMRIVCEIYEMDVIMQRELGMAVRNCDPFI